MSGPRTYSVATRQALAVLSRGACYYPGCTSPIVEFIDGEPFINCEIAHIRDARPGNRYVADMTDDERRAFSNLVLLCKPHHTLVDKTHPERFGSDLLRRWKADREGSGIDALAGLRGLTEARLQELIADATTVPAPAALDRSVDVELAAGILYGPGAMTLPIEGLLGLLRENPELSTAERVIVVTPRNQGRLPVTIAQYALWFGCGDVTAGVLTGADLFPFLNPPLPVHLEVGANAPFLFCLDQIGFILRELVQPDRVATDLRGEVTLGTGETIASPVAGIEHLPLWDDPTDLAEIAAELRSRHAP